MCHWFPCWTTCLESQGSNRIGYVTELLTTEHARNSDGARVLTPTQECKHCALIQLRNERCVLRVCLFRFLCSHSDLVRGWSNNCCTGWFTFPREALLVLSIIIICFRQEKAFCDCLFLSRSKLHFTCYSFGNNDERK